MTSSYKEKIREYEALLDKKDKLIKEAEALKATYLKEFGDLLNENQKKKKECVEWKKKISYCRRRRNRGLKVNLSHMQADIDKEMSHYDTNPAEALYIVNPAKEDLELAPFDIEDRICFLESQITEITRTAPYTYRDILKDEESRAAHREILIAEQDDYKRYMESLAVTLEGLLER